MSQPLIASVAIDVDHIPLYLGLLGNEAQRPVAHSPVHRGRFIVAALASRRHRAVATGFVSISRGTSPRSCRVPRGHLVVDLYHAREHLHSLDPVLEFILGDRDESLAARLEDLDYGYIDGIAAAVRAYPLEGVKKDEAEKELGYFLNNAPRMRYHWFRSRGLFTGSGVVEAGCKAVIGQRSSSPACTGPSTAPTPSSPCAAHRPAASGKPSATTVTTRQEPPDVSTPEDDDLVT